MPLGNKEMTCIHMPRFRKKSEASYYCPVGTDVSGMQNAHATCGLTMKQN